jgi:hypothetical protein
MHASSMKLMERLLRAYCVPAETKSVADIGSQDVNGTYKSLIKALHFKQYIGVDIASGDNVDYVVPENGKWTQVPKVDVVISGQCMEHVRRPWQWINQVADVIDTGGILTLIAPWQWEIHRYPVDCWRILPDGMEALLAEAGLEILEVGVDQNDCFGVAKKPQYTA